MQVSEASGRVVAADIETAFNSVDLAILDVARLTTTVMEAKSDTVIAPARFQGVVDSMSASLAKIVEGRKAMVSAHRRLSSFKGQSNLAEVNFGCFSITEESELSKDVNAIA